MAWTGGGFGVTASNRFVDGLQAVLQGAIICGVRYSL